MQTEVKKFQAEANDKAVDELVHLQRVKDLLIELKKQVPMEEPPKPWSYTGETGPAHWAALDPTFATCGKFQALFRQRFFISICPGESGKYQR